MRIRPATRRDADAVANVHAESARAAYRHIFGDAPFPADDARKMWRSRLAEAAVAVVAETSDDVVGFAVVTPDGTLTGLYVRPEWWRRGIGTVLLDAVPEACVLWVLKENVIGRAFYERHEWTPDDVEQRDARGVVEVRYSRRR